MGTSLYKNDCWVEEMAWWLRALVLEENPGSIPSIHMVIKAIHNSYNKSFSFAGIGMHVLCMCVYICVGLCLWWVSVHMMHVKAQRYGIQVSFPVALYFYLLGHGLFLFEPRLYQTASLASQLSKRILFLPAMPT